MPFLCEQETYTPTCPWNTYARAHTLTHTVGNTGSGARWKFTPLTQQVNTYDIIWGIRREVEIPGQSPVASPLQVLSLKDRSFQVFCSGWSFFFWLNYILLWKMFSDSISEFWPCAWARSHTHKRQKWIFKQILMLRKHNVLLALPYLCQGWIHNVHMAVVTTVSHAKAFLWDLFPC